MERDSWQRPDLVFEVMGDLRGRLVADLFSDDGYFTFKLVEQGARVLAIGVDAAKLEDIARRAAEMGLPEGQVVTRLVQPGEPGISMEEADVALCVNNYLNIRDRRDYFTRVRAGLRSPKQVIIIDWLPKDSPVGPPANMRISDMDVMDEIELYGFTDIGSYSAKLPYQFLMFAQDFVAGPEDQE